jgi:HlyD family secretion protein
MTPAIDLRQLIHDRQKPSTSVRRRSAIFARFAFPAGILLGFVGLLGWASRDWLTPARRVTVVPVLVARAEAQQAGTPLFQAAGWIEPRPTPILVPALAEGILAELLVVEGQSVDVGQPMARLVDADARLAVELAQSHAQLAVSEVQSAQAELKAAQQRLETPVHLEAVLCEAESQLARIDTELARVPSLIEAARAKSLFTQQNLDGKQAAFNAVPGRVIQEAQSQHSVAVAELKELQARQPQLEREREAQQKRVNALQRQFKLLIDEHRAVATAQARVAAAEARSRQAQLLVQAAELRLDRMTIKAPISGRVLALVARPGARVMGLDPGGEQRSSTVVTLYDPGQLQVRADVRLENVSQVRPGQSVRIETPAVKGVLAGQVLQTTSQANVQKNTLEVKVGITAPPDEIRPEMLVTATFLALKSQQPELNDAESSERLLVPRQLIETSGEISKAWVADAQGYARYRTIQLGKNGLDQLVEVVSGLSPTDRVIVSGRESLADGVRLIITEDNQIGWTAVSGR